MNFDESQKYLLSLGNEVEAMKLGLVNIGTLLKELGSPEANFPKVQIAGTNGKGSVCAFLNAICREAAIRTGLYTSPHLVSITERIKIAGDDISETDFSRIATHVRDVSEKLLTDGKLEYRPTFFEQVTAVALLAFAEAKVELAILETGLGGRFDATTAANAEIVGITPVDIDHQEYLGDTIEQIAAEKAAILRANVKAAIAAQKPEAEEIIQNVISENKVDARTTIGVTAEAVLGAFSENTDGGIVLTNEPDVFNLRTDRATYRDVRLGLKGAHQWENAKLAVLLAEILREGFTISDEAIVRGLATAQNPGRLEFVDGILLDGAHNAAGAEALAMYLRANNCIPFTLVFGAMRDKDIGGMAAHLFGLAERLIFTVAANSRSCDPREFLKFVPESKIGDSRITESAADAIELARQISDGELIVVAGSLYLIGEMKKVLEN